MAADLALCHPPLRSGEVRVIAHPLVGGAGHKVSVVAPDLWAIASWFEERGCNIEVANVDTEGGTATDTFLVHGPVDPDALATRLAGRPRSALPWPVTRGLSTGLAVGRGAARIATAPLRAAFRR